MHSTQTVGYLQVSDVFPGVQSTFSTFKSLLESLSLTDTLFWCARLNLIFSDPSDINFVSRQRYFLNQFFSKEERDRVSNILDSHGGLGKVALYFRGQLLELFRWATLLCNDQPNDGETFEDLSVCQKFVQAAFIAADIWSHRIRIPESFPPITRKEDVDSLRYKALGTIRKNIEGSMRASELPRALGRGWALFKEYFPQHYPTFHTEFLVQTGLTLEQYYACLGSVIVNCMNPQSTSGIFNASVDGAEIQNPEEFKKYLALESQTVEELREQLWHGIQRDSIQNAQDVPAFDYTPLRNKPIFRTKDGRAIIIDPVFYSETASVGPLFHLLKGSTSQEKNNCIFGAFGQAFEQYACAILRRIFETPDGLTNRLACNVHKTLVNGKSSVEIADACLNDVTEIVLFEIKATTLPEASILDENHESFLQLLRKKYSKSVGTQKERGIQGVAQLARTIESLASQQWREQNQEFEHAKMVYPVLVVHDHLLTAPIYGRFLAAEFMNCLLPDQKFPTGELKKGELQVALPIILTVDDLENLETSIERFGFRTVLKDYSRTRPERLMAFYDFLAFSEKYKNRIYPSRHLAGKTLEVLEQSVIQVFGKEKLEQDI